MSIRLTLYRRSTGPPTSSPTQHKYNAHVGAHVHPAHLVQAQQVQCKDNDKIYNEIILLTQRCILPEEPLLIKLSELFLLILLHETFL
jgi:hypothetical protein